jgi:hypothetical protein
VGNGLKKIPLVRLVVFAIYDRQSPDLMTPKPGEFTIDHIVDLRWLQPAEQVSNIDQKAPNL